MPLAQEVLPLASMPLAFIDLETTGLSPRADQIAEIGIVTVRGALVEEWSTLLKPAMRRFARRIDADERQQETRSAAPCFNDIAAQLAERLRGCTLIAHNARFDYAFLKAEFEKSGIDFCSKVICSAMLSRSLYGHFPRHDMDSVMARHNLTAETRHRALPDARLVWQFWQVVHREHSPQIVADSIRKLLAGPVLPPELDPVLVERLPELPGVYFLHGEKNQILRVGWAGNLRRHVINHFRMDRISAKAARVASRVRNITWRLTQGLLGARLQASLLSHELSPVAKARSDAGPFSWQLVPDQYPCACLLDLTHGPRQPMFGVFRSERRARKELLRLAAAYRLCHCLLGIGEDEGMVCLACPEDQQRGRNCGSKTRRLKHLARSVVAMTSWHRPDWPYAGAVGIRERADVHIVDDWRYLGTARNESEMFGLLEGRLPPFDENLFRFLARALARLPRRRLVDLPPQRRNGRRDME